MKKPIIGITSSYINHNYYMKGLYVHEDYQKAILGSGGIPITLTVSDRVTLKEYAQMCDGVILSGGGKMWIRNFTKKILTRNWALSGRSATSSRSNWFTKLSARTSLYSESAEGFSCLMWR